MGQPVNSAPATNVDPLRLGDDREPWITADGNTFTWFSYREDNSFGGIDIFWTHKSNLATEPER